MKKIGNMNVDEARQAFAKFEAKHPRNDDFDMNGLQIHQYEELFKNADKEAFISLLYDLFNYGFMAGYKQSEADLKTKIDKRVKDDMHRKLLELVFYLPFGYRAEYLYYMMSYLLPEDYFYFMPGRVAKPALAIRAEYEARKAKEAKQAAERTAEEKQAGEYRCSILRMLHDISNADILNYIKIIVEDIAKEDEKSGVHSDE